MGPLDVFVKKSILAFLTLEYTCKYYLIQSIRVFFISSEKKSPNQDQSISLLKVGYKVQKLLLGFVESSNVYTVRAIGYDCPFPRPITHTARHTAFFSLLLNNFLGNVFIANVNLYWVRRCMGYPKKKLN